MNSIFDKFTNLYSLSKTLRFELKPVKQTREFIEKNGISSIIEEDDSRALNYKYVKKLYDCMYRLFINDIFKDWDISIVREEDIIQCRKQFLQRCQAIAESWVKECFAYNSPLSEKKQNIKFDDLFKAISIDLLKWKINTSCIKISWKQLGIEKDGSPTNEECLEWINSFDKFITYFNGYFENRKNVFEVGKDFENDIASSLFYRTFKENLGFFKDNISSWEKLCKQKEKYIHFDWNKTNSRCSNWDDFERKYAPYFDLKSFSKHVTQSGIDHYNTIIGNNATNNDVKGVNEIANLLSQSINASSKNRIQFATLHKQILSQREELCADEITDSQELLNEVRTSLEICLEENILSEIYDMRYICENPEKMLLNKEQLNAYSIEVYGKYDTLLSLIETVDKNTKKKRKKQKYSIKEIDELTKKENKNFFSFIHEKFSVLKENLFDEKAKLKKRLSGFSLTENKKIKPEETVEIKNFLDVALNINRFAKTYILEGDDSSYWNIFWKKIQDDFDVVKLYNKARNFICKKEHSTDKLKLNFNVETLLYGWDQNKETNNRSIILKKDEQFFLLIMKDNRVFQYFDKKRKIDPSTVLANGNEDFYEKMVYKLLPGANKMLPKVFFAKSNIDYFAPSQEIQNINKNKLYKKENFQKNADGVTDYTPLYKIIDFYKQSLYNHPEWSREYAFKEGCFSDTQSYESIDQFYTEVDEMGFKLYFDKIKTSYIETLLNEDKIFLFKIYNKDFSQNKKAQGTDNLHTSYWKLLFDKSNCENTVIKLNGQAEIFFRKSSIKYDENKLELGHHHDDLKDKFAYPIIKNRRFTQDKILFHCPITLNFGKKQKGMYSKIRELIKSDHSNINIIGIDRGENHLLYYTIINQQGRILEQGSFNTISNIKPDGNAHSFSYHKKLDSMEKERDYNRKNWQEIGTIKEMKSGFLSQVVHKLSQLIIQHNAIVVLEDLNKGFKRGRFKIEKQVYQKFEKAMIDKLNYLVFKDKKQGEAGHFLSAYQLTDPFESFSKMGKQTGILFYVPAPYTSITDPITGFSKNIIEKYETISQSCEFWSRFDSIIFNQEKNCFEFQYNIENFLKNDESLPIKTQWTVCSCVSRSFYSKKEKKTEFIENMTTEFSKLFATRNIIWKNGENIIEKIVNIKDAEFYKSLLWLFNLLLNLRVKDFSKPSESNESDFIQSPVFPFFDSRAATSVQPANSDANGAYNIARKGICVINNIKEPYTENSNKMTERKNDPCYISKKQWIDFSQNQ